MTSFCNVRILIEANAIMSTESGLQGEQGTHSTHNSNCLTHTNLLEYGEARDGGDIIVFVNATEDREKRANPFLKARQTGFSQSSLTK